MEFCHLYENKFNTLSKILSYILNNRLNVCTPRFLTFYLIYFYSNKRNSNIHMVFLGVLIIISQWFYRNIALSPDLNKYADIRINWTTQSSVNSRSKIPLNHSFFNFFYFSVLLDFREIWWFGWVIRLVLWMLCYGVLRTDRNIYV